MNLQRLVPNFIKKLDHYLLINFPTVWQSRIHNVIYAVIATNIILVGLAFILPVKLGHRYDLWEWTWTFFIVSVSYFIIWMVHVGRFNLFKQYGKKPVLVDMFNFMVYMLCVALITSTTFSFHYAYDQKIRNAVSNYELAKDINALNLGAPFFPIEISNYKNYTPGGIEIEKNGVFLYDYHAFDKFGFDQFWNNLEPQKGNGRRNDYQKFEYESNKSVIEEIEINKCKEGKYGLNCFEKNKKIFNEKRSRSEQLILINNFINTAKKYGQTIDLDANTILNRFDSKNNYKLPTDLDYNYTYFNNINRVEDGIGYVIYSKTEGILFYEKDFWHALWYVCFYCTLLFILYRNVRRRDFILSIVSGIVIMILSGIILALSGIHRENDIFMFYFLIYCALGIGALGIFIRNKHSWLNAVCLNLVAVSTPILPIFYYWTAGHNNFNDVPSGDVKFELAGFIIFFILMQALFNRLYTRLWALPE